MKMERRFLIPMIIGLLLSVACIVPAIINLQASPSSNLVFSENVQYEGIVWYDNGFLIAGRDNTVRSTNLEGEEQWIDKELTNLAISMRVVGQNAYVAAGNKVYRYDIESGTRSLCCEGYEKDGNNFAFANITAIAVDDGASKIAVSHGSSKSKHNLTVISLDTGETIFSEAVGVTANAVVFSGSEVILGSDSGNVRLYNAEGKYTTITRLNEDIVGLCLDGESLYAVCSDGETALISLVDGTIKALHDLSIQNSLIAPSGIIVAGDGVFVSGKEGGIYAFDKNLSLKNNLRFSDGVSDLCSDGENLYFTIDGGGIYVNDLGSLLNAAAFLFVLFLALVGVGFGVAVVALLLSFPKVRKKIFVAGKTFWRHKTAYLMLVPVFGLLFVFGFYPVLVAALRAFTDWSNTSVEINFIGFGNFRMMISEGYFLTGIKNLLIFLVSYMVKILTMPLLVAIMVYSLTSNKSKFAYRYLYVLPMVVPSVVSALMWKNIYDPNFGLLNEVLEVLGLEQYQTSWLSDPKTAIASLVFVGFPFIDPFSFLIYYSAMMNIPSSTLEAAQLDGASAVRRLFFIILPMIASQIKILIMLGFINQIQDFNLILLLTQGGPGTMTYVPGYELYLNATSFGRYGYACALGLVMFIFIFAGTVLLNRVKVNKEVEG